MAEQFDFEGFWTEALEKYGGLIKGRDFYTDRLGEDHRLSEGTGLLMFPVGLGSRAR